MRSPRKRHTISERRRIVRRDEFLHSKAAAYAALTVGAFLYLTAPKRAEKDAMAPFIGRNFAHRGLHKKDGSVPENSIPAFRAACEKGYGSELDVQLSSDGQVFVFHDDLLKRVCGEEGYAEDFLWAELREKHLCGTEYTIPLFSEVLETVNGRTPLIVELKSTERYEALCEKTLALLTDYKARTGGDFCVESFDPRIVRWFRVNAPEIVRGQLSAPLEDLLPKEAAPLDYAKAFAGENLLGNFLTRPNFIAYEVGKKPLAVKTARALGAALVSWTSLDPEEEKTADAVIFQYYEPSPRYR